MTKIYISKVYNVFRKGCKIYINKNFFNRGLIKVNLEQIQIGDRIQEIRENVFQESRANFAKRCDLSERHIGQIERGDILFSLKTLNKIVMATGVDINYILYGKGKNNHLKIAKNLHNIIDNSSRNELQMYYKCVTTIKQYVHEEYEKKDNKEDK